MSRFADAIGYLLEFEGFLGFSTFCRLALSDSAALVV